MRNSAQLSIAQMVKAATSLVFRRTEITCKRFIISESSESEFIIRGKNLNLKSKNIIMPNITINMCD